MFADVHMDVDIYIYIYTYRPTYYCVTVYLHNRRTFRSQISDNMDRWKSRGGKSQRRKKNRRKKIQVREKVEKSRFTVVPQGPKAHKRSTTAHRCGGKQISKSKWSKHLMLGPLLQAALSKECTRQWREARFEVKILKNTTRSHHFWKLGFRKVRSVVHVRKSKVVKTEGLGPLFEVRIWFGVAGARDSAPCQK